MHNLSLILKWCLALCWKKSPRFCYLLDLMKQWCYFITVNFLFFLECKRWSHEENLHILINLTTCLNEESKVWPLPLLFCLLHTSFLCTALPLRWWDFPIRLCLFLASSLDCKYLLEISAWIGKDVWTSINPYLWACKCSTTQREMTSIHLLC